MKTKTFDCVEMKREGARRVHERTRRMTRAELVKFWQERTTELKQRARAKNGNGKH
jgi:hypothetical protein